jgi:DNA-nicking Smr family endonuclease
MGRGKDSEGENEDDLWNYVTRGIKAYKASKQPLPAAKPQIRKATPRAVPKFVPPPNPLPDSTIPEGRGFDRATETRLRRGQLPLEGRLDLHGKTQAEAFESLYRFIHAAVAHKKRTVLVITGKGQRFEGVLRKMVPQWLEDPALARYIVAITPAAPKDGGTGAFYLRLKKPR